MGRTTRSSLPSSEYDAIFAVLDDCQRATSLADLKGRLMSSLHTRYRFANTTFLTGPTFRQAFSDPNPVITGRISPIIDEYQSGWYVDDMFATPESFAKLTADGAICHSALRSLPSESVDYLEGFLYRHRLKSASVLHLELSRGAHAVVGVFDDEGKELAPQRIAGLGLLAGQLSNLAKLTPGQPTYSWRDRVTRRQAEIGELVADGRTNEEIAQILSIQLDTVKKHVSQILTSTDTRNRVEFARLAMSEESAPAS